ncbi:MAG: energy-coupling factor transporter ATPase [Lachnospiraceae bacterium]|nr:energy-coupling factor transporter ATPase [Lachnospiraceae bacterium]
MQIIVDHLTYSYSKGLVYERKALDDINLVINKGEYVCIIGHTGSGKSTLIQMLDGLLKPDSGTVYFDGKDIFDSDYSLKNMRGRVGLVFQYPEYQLFEASVIEDVKFGPRNIGMGSLETDVASFEALKMVGIGDELLDASPLELSGGEKRRVAIAGILAMKPEVLILDEPTAGLDTKGKNEILELVYRLNRERNITVILVSHNMEDAAKYADRVVVMEDGRIKRTGTPEKVFSHYRELRDIGLGVPEGMYILEMLKKAGLPVNTDIMTAEGAAAEILRVIRKKS